VGAEANVRVVERFLAAFNDHRLDRMARLTTPDQTIQLPDGTIARGRLQVARLIAWVIWRSRGTLRMKPLSVSAQGDCEVVARTRNTAKRGSLTLDLEMTLVFRLSDSRVAAINESVEDLPAWRTFWR
jgi:limonene-1,2-epoxide hydrolase